MCGRKKVILVVTGGIGSGKSLAAGMLNEMYGYPVYNADKRVKELYRTHPTLLSDIEREVGCSLCDDDGSFVPAALADVIFNDSHAMNKVESLVFPALKEDFELWLNEHPCDVQILESATILEKDFFDGTGDYVLLINAPFELRLNRAVRRDKASEKAVAARMNMQKMMNDLDLLRRESSREIWILENADSADELRVKLRDFVEKTLLTKML